MLLRTVQNAESGTILTENDDWNLFHISTWVEQSMHALPRKWHRDIRHITCMTCIFRDVFLLFIFYAQVDHRTSVQLWAFWSTFYRNLQKDNNKKMASYSYSSFTPVPFARNAHTESHSTGIGLITLGRRRICCVYFVPSFACIRLYHWPKAQLCEPVTKRRCWVQYKCKICCPKSAKKTFYFCVITLGYVRSPRRDTLTKKFRMARLHKQ